MAGMENSIMECNQDSMLGQGTYAVVYPGIWAGQKVAVKRIQLVDLLSDREETAMRDLNHPNILKLFDVVKDKSFKYLILELCSVTIGEYCKGKVIQRMPSEPDSLYQMADGLDYIHSKRFVHRDISTGNVLIKEIEGREAVFKISDFGFAKSASEEGSFSMSQGQKGTVRYNAPEILKLMEENPENRRGKSKNTSDIFSMGCLFFTFLTKGQHPYWDRSIIGDNFFSIPLNIMNNKYSLKPLEEKHKYALPLVEQMIHAIPDQRISLEKVKEMLEPLRTNKQTNAV